MKPKRSYVRLDRDQVLRIVRDYHAGGVTQASLAEREGLSVGYVNQMVHGSVWPDVYAEVAREHAQDGAEA